MFKDMPFEEGYDFSSVAIEFLALSDKYNVPAFTFACSEVHELRKKIKDLVFDVCDEIKQKIMLECVSLFVYDKENYDKNIAVFSKFCEIIDQVQMKYEKGEMKNEDV